MLFRSSSASKCFKYDNTDLSLIGGTITGGTIQTDTDGQRVELTSANGLRFYATDGTYSTLSQNLGDILQTSGYLSVDGTVLMGGTGYIQAADYISSTAPISFRGYSLYIGDGGSGTFGGNFQVNSSGVITKYDNATPTSGYYLRGNGTNCVLSAIQAGDIPDISATYIKWYGEVSNDPASPVTGGMWFNYTASKVRIKTSGGVIDLN